MAISLSAKAQVLLQKKTLEPNLILEIDGVDSIYCAIDVLKLAYFDDAGLFFDMPGLTFDGSVSNEDALAYISLGSSGNNITQQLLQDKGGSSSVTNMTIELIDFNNDISRLITPGYVIDDIIGTKARVYINYAGGVHPRDSVMVHRGIISNVESKSGACALVIDSPERQKHQELFIQGAAKLTASITNSDATITVDQTDQFYLPSDLTTHRSFIKIDDEIIEWTGKTGTTFTGCARGMFGTVAAAHDSGADANSMYLLSGNGIELALKLMLSGEEQVFTTENVRQFYKISPTENRAGAIFFQHYNIQEKTGLVVGDTVTITGSTGGLNDIVDAPIIRFGVNDYGSWIETATPVVLETTTSAVASFKSKYNVLSNGAGMTPHDVDVARHEEMLLRYNADIPDYEFLIEDSIKPNEFIAEQIYWPANFYALPRKAKASVGRTAPPIADQKVVVLDETNVIKPSQLKSTRSTNKYFYNSVVYKYAKSKIDGKYKNGKVIYSGDSQARIKNQGNKPLVIQSDGMRDDGDTENLIRTNSRRILERYQFASESYKGVKLLGKSGVTVEVGDAVVFGSPEFKLTNIDTADRVMTPKLYEVVNKNLAVKTQEVTVDLLSTNFELDGRYGVIAPATKLAAGSTTSILYLKDSFSTISPAIEKDKWQNYIGQNVTIHSSDWSFSETVQLVSFDPGNDYAVNISPPLSVAPLENYIMDMPAYDASSAATNSFWKMMHCCFNPTVEVASGSSSTQFDVAPGDGAKFTTGIKVRVHSGDYSIDSGDVLVSNITGDTITTADLGFVPASGQLVDLIGFVDGGQPYRWI